MFCDFVKAGDLHHYTDWSHTSSAAIPLMSLCTGNQYGFFDHHQTGVPNYTCKRSVNYWGRPSFIINLYHLKHGVAPFAYAAHNLRHHRWTSCLFAITVPCHINISPRFLNKVLCHFEQCRLIVVQNPYLEYSCDITSSKTEINVNESLLNFLILSSKWCVILTICI